jgi:hypothetical protein
MNRAGDAADPGTISRRDALKTFGAASATLAAGAPALRAKAQDRPAAVDDLGYYRFEIGDINATVIHDGTFVFPSAVFATNAPAAEIDDFLAGYNLPTASLVLPNTNLLLDTGRERILIDTGLGPYAFPGNERTSGKLLATLDALGIDRDSISTVFLTHAHPDHIGALTDTEEPPPSATRATSCTIATGTSGPGRRPRPTRSRRSCSRWPRRTSPRSTTGSSASGARSRSRPASAPSRRPATRRATRRS